MEPSNNSKSPKGKNVGKNSISIISEKSLKKLTQASNSKITIADNVKSLARENMIVPDNENDIFSVNQIKTEVIDSEDENDFGNEDDSSYSEDPLHIETSTLIKSELEERLVKLEKVDGDVKLIHENSRVLQPESIFIKSEFDETDSCLSNENEVFIIKKEPVFLETESDDTNEEVSVVEEIKSSSGSGCIDLSDDNDTRPKKIVLEKKPFKNTTLINKSNFLDILKNNLKRKSEQHEKMEVKKLKLGIGTGSNLLSGNGKSAAAASAVPALGKLRNIIGSNFKKLNLSVTDPSNLTSELGLSYKNEDNLLNDNITSDGTGYKCPKCNSTFKWKTTLKFHMFNHLENKAVECDICFKIFLSEAFLEEHKRSHHLESNFNCKDCNGQFDTEAGLSCHMVTHEKKKHYVCNICKEKFTSLYSLNSHKAKHSASIKYECKPCDLRFKSLKTLTKHIASHEQKNTVSEIEECKLEI